LIISITPINILASIESEKSIAIAISRMHGYVYGVVVDDGNSVV